MYLQGESVIEILEELVSRNGSNITGSDVATIAEGLIDLDLNNLTVRKFIHD